MNTLMVKVIKASEDTFWYTRHIGEVFEVRAIPNRHNEYDLVEEPGGSTFSIGLDDCEIVTPHKA